MSYGTSDTTVISSTKTEARNLNAIDASAASRDDSSPATIPTTTPQNRHGSAAGMTETDITNRLVLARQRRLLNLRTQIVQLEEELLELEESAGFQIDDQNETYTLKRRKQEFLTKTLEELLNKPIDSYNNTQGSLPTLRRPANSSQDLSSLNSRFANFNLEDSSCQTTVPAQEQTTLLQKSASQADTRATIPFGEQVNPLDEFIHHDDRWSASDISFRGSTPITSDGHKEDHCSGPTQNVLCVQQDSIGPYVTFTTRNGRRHKFYTRTLGNYLRTKLTRIEDYPQWCWSIRNFSSTFQFDDITLLSGKDKIPLDENLLLREILLKSVGENMERYFLHHNDTLKIFSTIRLEYQKRFTTSIRDKTWSTISIGRECPDIDAVDRMLTKMVLQEQYGNPSEEKYRARNEFINGKILKSMQEELRDYIILKDERLTKDNLQDLLPTDLISILVTFLWSLASYRDSEIKSCQRCHSSLHVSYRCPFPVPPRPTYYKQDKKGTTKINDESTYTQDNYTSIKKNSGSNSRPGKQKSSGQNYRFKQKKGSSKQ